MSNAHEVVTSIVDRIATQACQDTRHVIRFLRDGDMAMWTLDELDRRATRVARRLSALGLAPRDRVGVMAGNRIEWVLVDLAVLKLGATTAGFEAGRFSPTQIVDIYGLRVLFTDDGSGAPAASGSPVLDLAQVLAWSADPSFDSGPFPLHLGYDPADILAIKFTSGSTGVPKGLEATVASVDSSIAATQAMFAHGDGDQLFVFLRLALLQQRYWVYSALAHGHDITIADLDRALDTAPRTAPTVVMGVPGFYEQLRARLIDAHGPALDDVAARRDAIQRALGGRVRYLWTGSAPCSRAVLDFFNDADVPLYEGYGLNETCIVAKNHPGAFRRGSVGRVLPDKTVRFDRDGTLIVGAKHPVNCRYTWCGEGVNEKTFLPTGEVKTWDLGHVDEDGFLFIHGRADDVLTLSSGRNVLVRLVEERLREHADVHEVVLVGNGRPFLSAIVSPARPAHQIDLAAHVATVNASLLPEQRVHALVIADTPFSIDDGLLTSQFKPRRAAIHARWAAPLGPIYDAAGPRVPDADRLPLVLRASLTEADAATPSSPSHAARHPNAALTAFQEIP